MWKRKRNLVTAAALAGLTILVTPAVAYEEPRYEVVDKDGDFELRRYEPYVVSEMVVSGERDQVSSQAFMRLFRYIGGKNRKKIRPDDPEIAMTVPVTTRQDGDSMRMTFMVPSRYTLETAPQPADPDVQIRAEPGGLVAVLTYSGRPNQERFLEHKGLLETWVAESELKPTGEPILARYDGPFKPWFLRRNEALLAVTEVD
jgi:hypothetical protein